MPLHLGPLEIGFIPSGDGLQGVKGAVEWDDLPPLCQLRAYITSASVVPLPTMECRDIAVVDLGVGFGSSALLDACAPLFCVAMSKRRLGGLITVWTCAKFMPLTRLCSFSTFAPALRNLIINGPFLCNQQSQVV